MPTKKKAKLPQQFIEEFAREQRLTAAHEAGHVVVAAVQGFITGAEIWKEQTVTLADEHMWQGKAVSVGHQSAEVDVAGTVAEQLSRYPDANVIQCLDLFYEVYDEGDISETDLQRVPSTYEELDLVVASVCKILRENWPFFEWARNKLLQDGYIWTHEVDDYCREYKVKRIPHPSAGLSIEMRKANEAWRALPPEARMSPGARSAKGVRKTKTAGRQKMAKKITESKPATELKRRKTK